MEMNDFLPMSLTVTRGGEKEVITVSESVTTFSLLPEADV